MDIILANPRGFCAGVDRAIEIVNHALDLFGAPIYVRHEVVHNRFVVNGLRDRGAIFVDELEDIPDNATVIFSAHGVAKAIRAEAEQRGLKIFDATCPLVTKVHMEVIRQCKKNREVVLIGHAGHPEVEGTMGQCAKKDVERMIHLVETPDDVQKLNIRVPDQVAYVSQTTLSIDDTQKVIAALKERYPKIIGPKKDDICYATQNRQDAVKSLVKSCDLILVVGSKNSSNSNRLREIAEKAGIDAYLIDDATDIEKNWVNNKTHIGVTAGASAPDVLVKAVLDKLMEWGATDVHEQEGKTETVFFPVPKELRKSKAP